jgi:hypothetical protein
MKTTYCPRARLEGLDVQELAGETLVFDRDSAQANCLNETASLVWKYADGTRSVSEIAGAMALALHAPVEPQVVWYALEQLSKKHLLQERVPAPPAYANMSRRAFLSRAGMVGAAVAIPVIISIVAPTPAHAQSGCLQLGQSCTASPQCCSNCCAGLVCSDPNQCFAQ